MKTRGGVEVPHHGDIIGKFGVIGISSVNPVISSVNSESMTFVGI